MSNWGNKVQDQLMSSTEALTALLGKWNFTNLNFIGKLNASQTCQLRLKQTAILQGKGNPKVNPIRGVYVCGLSRDEANQHTKQKYIVKHNPKMGVHNKVRPYNQSID